MKGRKFCCGDTYLALTIIGHYERMLLNYPGEAGSYLLVRLDNNLLCVKSYLPLGQLLSLRQFEIIQLQSITLFNFCRHFAQGKGSIDTAKVISLPSKCYLPSFLKCSGTFRSRVSSIIYIVR